jgi:hypothetical protein
VVEAVTQPGGFSPGVAARLKTATGKRAFVKAVGPVPNPESPDIHRAEARIAASLPEGTPAPRLLGFFDQDGWVALMFEDIEGHLPAQPWAADELARVLQAVAELAVALTPAPIDAPTVADRFGEEFRGWRRLAEAGRRGEGNLAGLDPWARRHLADLAALENRWAAAAAGASLVHADLRADNLLLTGDRVVVVDWPWACLAVSWFDLVAVLPSSICKADRCLKRSSTTTLSPRPQSPTLSPPFWPRSPASSCDSPASRLPRACPRCVSSRPLRALPPSSG